MTFWRRHPKPDSDLVQDLTRRDRLVASHPKIPVAEIKEKISLYLGGVLALHGFRRAEGTEEGWVRPCGDSILQIVAVQFREKFQELQIDALLRVGAQWIEREKLWSGISHKADSTTFQEYSETTPDVTEVLTNLMPDKRVACWIFPRHEVDPRVLHEMSAALTDYGFPFLKKFRSIDDLVREAKGRYASLRSTQYVTELRYSCVEFLTGQTSQAIKRVEKALSTQDSASDNEIVQRRRAVGEALLGHFKSR